MYYTGRSFHDVLLPSAQEYLPGGAAYMKAMNTWSMMNANHSFYSVIFVTLVMVMVAISMSGVVLMSRKYQVRKQQYMGINSYGR